MTYSDPGPLIVFILVIIAVVAFVLHDGERVKIPFTGGYMFLVRFYYPPLVGVFLLLLFDSIDGEDIWLGGIAGDHKIKPFTVMVQFETLAYVCIALDMTGILAYIALRVVAAAGSSGTRLFFYFYAVASAFTICTSNDIVILTLTPLIYYVTKMAKINPMPMLYAEFFTANICSMVLQIGNPVNLIVAQAEGLTFSGYSNWMAAPALCGSVTCCGLMYLWHHKDIDVTITPVELRAEEALKDVRGVWFHGIVLLLTRILLGVAPQMGTPNYPITVVAAGISGIYNMIYWGWDVSKLDPNPTKTSAIELEIVDTSKGTPSKPENAKYKPIASPTDVGSGGPEEQQVDIVTQVDIDTGDAATAEEKEKLEKVEKTAEIEEPNPLANIPWPTMKQSILNCPWAVIPFVFGMFTIVGALNKVGWIAKLAGVIVNAIPADEGNSARAIAIACFLMTTISFVGCMLIDNQPASILLTHVILADSYLALPEAVRNAGMFGVIEGANVGGCWSLMGALAGIMWSTLLRNKGIVVGYIPFMKTGLRVMPFVTFMVSCIIIFEHIGHYH